MSDVVQTKEDFDSWQPFDFTRYFYNKAIDSYGENTFEANYERDCPMFKHIINIFVENSRNKLSVRHFIDWAFTRYEQKKLPPPITVGFLKCWVPIFLQIPERQKKVYNHLEKVTLTRKQREWVKAKRQAYKAGDSVFTPPEKPKRRTRKKPKGGTNET